MGALIPREGAELILLPPAARGSQVPGEKAELGVYSLWQRQERDSRQEAGDQGDANMAECGWEGGRIGRLGRVDPGRLNGFYSEGSGGVAQGCLQVMGGSSSCCMFGKGLRGSGAAGRRNRWEGTKAAGCGVGLGRGGGGGRRMGGAS